MASDLTREHLENLLAEELEVSGAETFFETISLATFRTLSRTLGVIDTEDLDQPSLIDKTMAILFQDLANDSVVGDVSSINDLPDDSSNASSKQSQSQESPIPDRKRKSSPPPNESQPVNKKLKQYTERLHLCFVWKQNALITKIF